jgi:hypothetical protein
MVVTAYASAATLLDRVASTDVMKAASNAAMSSKTIGEAAFFVLALAVLHLAFAMLTWLLGVATALIYPIARIKFGRILVGWFCVLAGATLAYNALWFPRTLIGAYYHNPLASSVGGYPIGQIVYITAFGACALVLLLAAGAIFRHAERAVRRRGALVAIVVLLLGAGVLFWPVDRLGVATAASTGRPNIIILGIDSLRLEQLRRFGGTGVTPNLDHFLANADLFRDTTTPLGRTFSSWTAILTGRSPTMTGARFNLADRSGVKANPTIGDVLRSNGYRTVYSTDEVRFANIDLWFRSSGNTAHRRVRLHHRHVQRVAPCVADHQYQARQMALSVLLCESRRRDDVRAGNLRRPLEP